MTGYDTLVKEDERERREGKHSIPEPESRIVYLPFNSPGHASDELCTIKARLREGQCTNVIGVLRNRLLALRQFQNMRSKHVSGQKATTWAATLIESLNKKIADLSCKYNECYSSYVALVGEEAALPLRRLEKSDVRVYGVEDSDADAIKHLNRLDARDPRTTASRRKVNSRKQAAGHRDPPGMSTSLFSWIWLGGGIPLKSQDRLMHDSKCCLLFGPKQTYLLSTGICREWSKAHARKERWGEEVALLKEEMRRVLATLDFKQTQWEDRAAADNSLTADVHDGQRAYALKQAAARSQLKDTFRDLWLRSEPPRGKVWDEGDALRLLEVKKALGLVPAVEP